MATKEMPQETYDFSFYYITTNVLAKLHSSRSTTLHRSRIFLTPFCKQFSYFFLFFNETQRIDIIFLTREHRQPSASDFADFWICCMLFGYVLDMFFCRKSYLGGENQNSFLKISSVVIEIFRKFKMAFVRHIKRQANMVIYIYIKEIINSENCFWG